MLPHQQRVADEKTELDKKIDDLRKFINKNPFYITLPEVERYQLLAQHGVMLHYSSILGDRIKAFKASGESLTVAA